MGDCRARDFVAYLELGSAMAIVGSSFVVGKILVAQFPVFLVSGLRFAVASAVLLWLVVKLEGGFPSLGRRDLGLLFLQSLAGVFLFSLCQLYGLKLTSATAAGIIMSTLPAVIGVMSFLFLRERITWSKGAAIALALLGVLAINLGAGQEGGGGGASPLTGNLLILGAVVGEALFTILAKTLSPRVTPLSMAALVSLFGLVMFLPLAVYQAGRFDFSQVGPGGWLQVLYLGVVVTVVAFNLWYRGVSKVPASVSGVFTAALPVSAVILAILWLKEPFSWVHLVGMCLVLGGMGFMVREGRETEIVASRISLPQK